MSGKVTACPLYRNDFTLFPPSRVQTNRVQTILPLFYVILFCYHVSKQFRKMEGGIPWGVEGEAAGIVSGAGVVQGAVLAMDGNTLRTKSR